MTSAFLAIIEAISRAPIVGAPLKRRAARNRSQLASCQQFLAAYEQWIKSSAYFGYRAWTYVASLAAGVPTGKPGIFELVGLTAAERAKLIKFRSERGQGVFAGARREYNELFVAREIKQLATLMPEAKLTPSQATAAVTLDDICLVIAGAGSGKTRVIVARAEYLVRRGGAKPEEIAVVAFNKEAALEIEKRLGQVGIKGATVSTIHALGLKISREKGNQTQQVSDLVEENRRQAFTAKWIEQALTDPLLQGWVVSWLADYRYSRVDESRFKTLDEFYQAIPRSGYRTINGERVKSHQEQRIADALFLLGIKYDYEAFYKGGGIEDRKYRPDFYLPDYDVYLEHFGIDRAGKTAPFIDAVQYNETIAWKRQRCSKDRARLIETYSYELAEESALAVVQRKLTSIGIQCKPADLRQLSENIAFRKAVNRLASLLDRFLSLSKANRIDLAKLKERRAAFQGEAQRAEAFLRIYVKLFLDYEQQKDGLDFADMINVAADILQSETNLYPWKHVLVDEFQDVSRSAFELIKGLVRQQPQATLFAVGDDWQSIYRFAGADITIMEEMHKSESVTSVQIEETFRMPQELADAAAQFVSKNSRQIPKVIKARANDWKQQQGFLFQPSRMPFDGESLAGYLGNVDGSVLVLTRYLDQATAIDRYISARVGKGADISVLTIHKAKGLEADHVAIVGLEDDYMGFPCFMEDDPLLGIIMTSADTYPLAEERRLFYVAMTRAKRTVTLFHHEESPSSFAEELGKDLGSKVSGFRRSSPTPCPICGRAEMRLKEAVDGRRAGLRCFNAPLCKGWLELCPACKNGGLLKQGRGPLLCSNVECGGSFKYSKEAGGYAPATATPRTAKKRKWPPERI